jgi:MFS family permease
MKTKTKKIIKPALIFIFLMGIVSLFSDMTHESARSLYGIYLSLAGASAAVIGFVTGLGEFVGYSLRFVSGVIADKKKNYWTMAIIGYIINMVAIPALAFVPQNGWILACIFIVMERVGKGLRNPAKNTLISFASSEVGAGKSFAFAEFMDQIGAFLGPLILFVILLIKNDNSFSTYSFCFGILIVPAILTITILLISKKKYPNPENFENKLTNTVLKKSNKSFLMYLTAISLLGLGFIDYPLISMHIFKLNIVPENIIPLIYSGAMLIDAFAALIFGNLFDKIGLKSLVFSSIITSVFSVFIFSINTLPSMIFGILLWGISIGAQESIFKSAVAIISPYEKRSTAFGIFESVFGLFWFLGSWLMGVLYDISILYLVIFSVIIQLMAVPFLYITWKNMQGKKDNI